MANDIGNKKSVSAVIARETLGSLVRDVWKNRTEIILTVRGKHRAKIVPIDYENEDCTNKNIENRKLIDIVDDLRAGKVFISRSMQYKFYAFYHENKFKFTFREKDIPNNAAVEFDSVDKIKGGDGLIFQCFWIPYTAPIKDA